MTEYFYSLILIFFRLLPIFVVAPIASFKRVPVTVRIILVGMLAMLMVLGGPKLADPFKFEWPLLGTELLIGMLLAFSFHAASATVAAMGQLIDIQMGLAAGAVFDPNTEQMLSPTGELLSIAFFVSFFTLNMHHDLLHGFVSLLNILPLGSNIFINDAWLGILAGHFALGFIILSPVIISLWLIDLVLALISRSLPQAQIYFVGLPVKIGLGFFLLAWLMNNFIEPLHRLMLFALESWGLIFRVSYG